MAVTADCLFSTLAALKLLGVVLELLNLWIEEGKLLLIVATFLCEHCVTLVANMCFYKIKLPVVV